MSQKKLWSRRQFVTSAVTSMGLTAVPYFSFSAISTRHLSRQAVKIPITMCHGINARLTRNRFEQYLKIMNELGFSTINYDQLYAWLTGTEILPNRPLLIDVDHPVQSVFTEMFPLMERYGFTGNLFVNTGYFEERCGQAPRILPRSSCATWDQIYQLMTSGWTIGAHTHTHPNLSELSLVDPNGEALRREMETNDALLEKHLGTPPQYFAFTGNSTGSTWSTIADIEAKQRYQLGRLWIIGHECEVDGEVKRYADLVGADGPDEADGGPPHSTRYITHQTPLFKIPSMELERLIYEPEAFRQYLSQALV